VSLVARHLEENGIPTVLIGCARDIVEQCGVPRFVFSDFPLGNPCGRPFDPEMQRQILDLALDVLESACAPRTTVQTGFVWSDDPSWKADFDSIASLEREGATPL
jgi:D-proline reductase (dithiol) PrdB